MSVEQLYNRSDLARLLGVSIKTLEKWAWEGKGPAFVKVGGHLVRYRPSDVAAYLEANKTRSEPDKRHNHEN